MNPPQTPILPIGKCALCHARGFLAHMWLELDEARFGYVGTVPYFLCVECLHKNYLSCIDFLVGKKLGRAGQ